MVYLPTFTRTNQPNVGEPLRISIYIYMHIIMLIYQPRSPWRSWCWAQANDREILRRLLTSAGASPELMATRWQWWVKKVGCWCTFRCWAKQMWLLSSKMSWTIMLRLVEPYWSILAFYFDLFDRVVIIFLLLYFTYFYEMLLSWDHHCIVCSLGLS